MGSKLTPQTIKLVIILGLAVVACYGIKGITKSKLEKTKIAVLKEKKAAKKISEEVGEKLEIANKFNESVEKLTLIPKIQYPTVDGYDSESSRIRFIQPLVMQHATQYNISKVGLKLSDIAPYPPMEENKELKVYNGQIQLTFETITDSLARSYMRDIIAKIPGNVQVNDMQIAQIAPLTSEYLANARASGVFPPLIRVNLVLNWITLKDTKNNFLRYSSDITTTPTADAMPTDASVIPSPADTLPMMPTEAEIPAMPPLAATPPSAPPALIPAQ
jgi:hypothetical protein